MKLSYYAATHSFQPFSLSCILLMGAYFYPISVTRVIERIPEITEHKLIYPAMAKGC